jgi:hypothetical protein
MPTHPHQTHTHPKVAEAAPEAEADSDDDDEAAAAKAEASKAGRASYDYLLSMALWSLTSEKVAALQEDADGAEAEVGFVDGEGGGCRACWPA